MQEWPNRHWVPAALCMAILLTVLMPILVQRWPPAWLLIFAMLPIYMFHQVEEHTGQQLSLLVGILLLSRIEHKYGGATGPTGDSMRAFPAPSDLAGVRSQSIRALGFSGHKANFVLTLASAIRNRSLDLEQLAYLDNKGAVGFLQGLSGVGRWTAEYVLLRGLGRLDIYPGDDVGARNNLARFLGRRKPLDYEGVRRAVARWQPYAGFIYFHLLLARIKEAGWLKSNEGENLPTEHDAA